MQQKFTDVNTAGRMPMTLMEKRARFASGRDSVLGQARALLSVSRGFGKGRGQGQGQKLKIKCKTG